MAKINSIGLAPITIAQGGTDATSMTTSSGVIRYTGSVLATTVGAALTSGGIMTNSAQPCFQVYAASTLNSVTGDGTSYTVVFNTTSFDQGSNFSSNTTFTAPVTGKYFFAAQVYLSNISASFTYSNLSLVATGGSWLFNQNAPGKEFFVNELTQSGTAVITMTAGDTATVSVAVGGGSKSVNLLGGYSYTTFYGYLIC
jgi:hypothetical protein